MDNCTSKPVDDNDLKFAQQHDIDNATLDAGVTKQEDAKLRRQMADAKRQYEALLPFLEGNATAGPDFLGTLPTREEIERDVERQPFIQMLDQNLTVPDEILRHNKTGFGAASPALEKLNAIIRGGGEGAKDDADDSVMKLPPKKGNKHEL